MIKSQLKSDMKHHKDETTDVNEKHAKSMFTCPSVNPSVLCLWATNAIDHADEKVFPSVMKAMETSMGFDLKEFGMINVVRACSTAFAGPVWARMADTGDRRVLMAGACFSWGLISCCCAFAFSKASFIGLMVLNGVLLSSMGPIAQSVVPDVAPPGQVGRAFGLMKATGHIGCIVATFVTTISQMEIYGMAGWRVAFLFIGAISIVFSFAIFYCFIEPRSAAKIQKNSEISSMQTYAGIVRNKTWLLVCFQGIFGKIPHSALHFLTMWLQYIGFTDFAASWIATCQICGLILGAMVSGYVGDWAATRSPDHGRIWCAVIADSLRAPVVIGIFVLAPNFGTHFLPFAVMVFLIGFLMPWPEHTCGKVIFTEIVPDNARASIVAAKTIVERCTGSIGGIMVGHVAQSWYAYDTKAAKGHKVAEMSFEERTNNANALGSAMLATTVPPWLLCTLLYGLVHFTYKHDRDRARALSSAHCHPQDRELSASYDLNDGLLNGNDEGHTNQISALHKIVQRSGRKRDDGFVQV